MEAAMIFATLVRRFRFAPLAGHKPKPVARVTLRPATADLHALTQAQHLCRPAW
jgi:hypothetical protein